MSGEATSEQSSIREGAGYDEVFQLGYEPDEGFSWLSKRETSAHSPDNEVESYDGGEVKEEEREDGEDEGDDGGEDDEDEGGVEGRASKEGNSRSPRDGHTRPFILPKMWTVNADDDNQCF